MALVLSLTGFAVTGCKKQSTNPLVGIFMPTKEQPIWAAYGARLEEGFKAAGYDVVLEFAEDVAERQVGQIENAITKGAKYVVIAAVDSFALTDVCQKAKDAKIKVISCDRLLMNTPNVDYYVTFDMIRLGEIQGEAIVDALNLKTAAGPFNMEIFSGSPDDNNIIPFYEGFMKVIKPYLDSKKLVVKSGQVSLAVTGILKWDSATAQSRMDNILGAYYTKDKLDVVHAMADCLSLGVISSLTSFGYGAGTLKFPVVTGQDSELTAVKSIIEGKQTMTMFLDPKILTEKMLSVVKSIEDGTKITPDTTYNNGKFDVPTILYDPVKIDKTNYTVLVDRGFYTKEALGIK